MANHPLVVFVCFAVLFYVTVPTNCIKLTDEDVKDILDGVPREERPQFLKDHLKRGYDLVEMDRMHEAGIISLQENTEISIGLYLYYKNNDYFRDPSELQAALGDVICFPGIGCIEIDDPGLHPM